MGYCILAHKRKVANEDIKKIVHELHEIIVTSVAPDSIMDHLFSKYAIGEDDYHRLLHVPVSTDRCRHLLSRLHVSSHPQAFIHLRLALSKEYPWIVDQIDQQIPPLTSQLQQLQLGHASDGKLSS